jgi:DNA repair protein RecN (Recombination protein N)
MPKAQLCVLQVEHLGPIDHATLEFSSGLNVLTGETGAGKTLLIGALTLCAGESDVRGLQKGSALRASAVFQTSDGEVSLTHDGDDRDRLRSTRDGLVVSAKALSEAASELIVIYGQSASQRLRTSSEALRIIDACGDIDARPLAEARRRIDRLTSELHQLGGDDAARAREAEYTRFQLGEFHDVAPKSETELDEVLERLTHLTTLRDNVTNLESAAGLLDGDDTTSASALLRHAGRTLSLVEPLATLSLRLKELSDEVTEIARTINESSDLLAGDDHESESLETRATQLHSLIRKFGGSLAAAIAQEQQLRESLDRLESAETTARDLEDQIQSLEIVIREESARLREQRELAGVNFVAAVSKQLGRVALSNAVLDVVVGGDDGSDVMFMFSADRRRPPGPLHQLASGGELARVLLAMSLESLSDGVVAVFDEVDSGIGGSVAEQIGECLRELAARQQVIVVTHLASIAALADRHFVVRGTSGEVMEATVTEVTGDERITEIARMLAGDSAPREAHALAEQLLSRRVSR